MSEPIDLSDLLAALPEEGVASAEEAPSRAPATRKFDVAADTEGGYSSFNELPPDIQYGFMESIARAICRDSQRGAERIKAAMKEGEDRG